MTYICPTKFSDVGFCPTKITLCPIKIKSVGQMSCQVKYLFAALNVYLVFKNKVHKVQVSEKYVQTTR